MPVEYISNVYFIRHLCDGSIQCPSGDDELNCSTKSCTGFYRCVESKYLICLHIKDVCNGYKDCPSGEDELLCDIPSQCPEHCICLMYAIKCNDSYALSLISIEHIVMSKFFNVTTDHLGRFLVGKNKIVLIWINSQIKHICPIVLEIHYYLHFLDLTHNEISVLDNFCMFNTPNLKVIVLKNNCVKIIKPKALKGINKIMLLDLSNNSLTEISGRLYIHLDIYIINISHNHFERFDDNIINYLKTSVIATNDYRICCIFRQTVATCIANQLLSVNCKTIFNTLFSKTITIITCSFLIFLNILGILFIYLKDRSIIFQNILYMHLSGLLYGLYLLSLFSANHYFGHTFPFYCDKWIKHIFCKVISFISLFTNLSYNYLLNSFLICQVTAVTFPLYFVTNKERSVKYLPRGLIIISILCCVLYSVRIRNGTLSSLCTLIENTAHGKMQVVTLTLILIQTVSCVIVPSCYLITFKQLRKSQIMKQAGLKKDNQIFVQGFLVSSVHLSGMLGSTMILILSIMKDIFSSVLLTWNIILIIPLPYILNPFILSSYPFLLRRKKTKQREKKTGNASHRLSEFSH